MQVNMLDAKSQLSKLVKAALAGEDVIIANKGVPVVKLVPVTAMNPNRKPGAWAHLKMTEERIANAFSPETNAEIARLFDVEMPKPPSAKIPANRKPATTGKNRKK